MLGRDFGHSGNYCDRASHWASLAKCDGVGTDGRRVTTTVVTTTVQAPSEGSLVLELMRQAPCALKERPERNSGVELQRQCEYSFICKWLKRRLDLASLTVAEREQRENIIIRALADGKGVKGAVVEAGYSTEMARHSAMRICERATRSSPMVAELERAGVDRTRLAEVIRNGLEARRPDLITKDGTRFAGGADHATRHRFLETAVRLRGEDLDRETTATAETHEQRIFRLRGLSPVK